MPSDGRPFALCLTHDVDRPYKTYQFLYDAWRRRSAGPLRKLARGANPYWRFEDVMALEEELGVRSAFYFLDEPPLYGMGGIRSWLRPANWVEHLGRYDPTRDEIAAMIRELDAGGWEVGLHGSRRAASDPDRLAAEKDRLESVLGRPVKGCRHHHLVLRSDTWRRHGEVGLRYDASLGSSTATGFDYGYRPLRPFDDDFLVFPLTAMEVALPDPGDDPGAARRACDRLLDEAAANDAVMTVLWHPRYFSESDFPGYRDLYRYLVVEALDRGALVGTPGEVYKRLVGG